MIMHQAGFYTLSMPISRSAVTKVNLLRWERGRISNARSAGLHPPNHRNLLLIDPMPQGRALCRGHIGDISQRHESGGNRSPVDAVSIVTDLLWCFQDQPCRSMGITRFCGMPGMACATAFREYGLHLCIADPRPARLSAGRTGDDQGNHRSDHQYSTNQDHHPEQGAIPARQKWSCDRCQQQGEGHHKSNQEMTL